MNTAELTSALKRNWKPLAAVAAFAGMILYSAGTFHPKVGTESEMKAAGSAIPAGTALYTVRAAPLSPRIEIVGTVNSAEKIQLSARLSAYVKEVKVSAGSAVKKGDLLVLLDGREIAEQVSAAEANLDQAGKEHDRAEKLFKANASTEQAMTAAETIFKAAKSQAEQARVMLSFTRISAPIDGIVTERRIEVGDLANPGQVLTTVYDPTRLRLEAAVPARLAQRLGIGKEYDVSIEGPDRAMKGTLVQVVSEIDPMSRTQTVKVDLKGDTTGILPGTFGRLFIDDEPRSVLLVPATAVSKVGQLEIIQVVQNSRAQERLVKTGDKAGDKVEILSGISDGETIVVAPIH